MAGFRALLLIPHTYSQRWPVAAGELELQDPHLVWVAGVEDYWCSGIFDRNSAYR